MLAALFPPEDSPRSVAESLEVILLHAAQTHAVSVEPEPGQIGCSREGLDTASPAAGLCSICRRGTPEAHACKKAGDDAQTVTVSAWARSQYFPAVPRCNELRRRCAASWHRCPGSARSLAVHVVPLGHFHLLLADDMHGNA